MANTAAFRNRVLNAWANSSAGDIADAEGVTRNVVLSIVRRGRETGDPRAVTKPHNPRKPGWWTEGDPRVMEIARAGAKASVEARYGTLVEAFRERREKLS
ncbi:hypothetical protein DC522_05810 [Microvirga sp. KLBC 81]|uniref:hypothetical protein n=1 Tax=Microvirga sp. KLBC 81 TaxID=1862707 RepID=UPI000D50EA3A|nr:hypothetical protein [Microvirga sp. KLBC 81]PVE25410.1 hypothetical protein DC522_05810 [Microvirga sp. KLBC 81]